MLIPFALFVSLLVATAIIAHVSDTLGKRLGKKRVSVLGLRPRHTATVLTIGSSWGIMIFTLAVLLAVVTPLRNALFYYESDRARLTDQAQKAKTELRTTQRSLDEIRTQSENFQADVLKFQGQSQKFQQQSRQYQGQAQEFKEQAQEAQQKFQTAQRGEQTAKRGEQIAKRNTQSALLTARNAQASARSAVASAKTARAQQLAAQTALVKTQSSLRDAQGRLNAAQSRLQKAQAQYSIARQKLVTANQEAINAGKQAFKAGRKALQAQREADRTKQEVTQAQAEVARYEGQVETLKTQIADLSAQANVLYDAAAEYKSLTTQLAFGDISLFVDQTLSERRFDITRSPADMERELRILINDARATARGILKNDELEFEVGATILNKSGGRLELRDDQTVEFYANALSSPDFYASLLTPESRTVSARLVSGFNYPSTTPRVVARFVFIPIRTIYIARQNIAEATIDTNKSESAIFRQLQDLVDQARVNAIKNGANPPLITNPNAPNFFFDGDTGQKMFTAWHQVQAVGHPVRVRIVAARDLDSAESLQIRFVVGDEA